MPAIRPDGLRTDLLIFSPPSPLRRAAALLLASLMLASTTGCAGEGNDLNHGKTFANPTHAQLAAAVRDGDDRLARELVAAGANPDAVDDKGVPLLQWAMLQQDRGAYRLLLELRADPTRGNADGQTALHLAAMGKDAFWLDDLLERGVSPDVPNTVTGAPPLFDALRARLPDNVHRLLEAGARLDTHDRSGTTPLHQAALVNDPASALEFLEAGADPRATDRSGATFQDYLYDGDPAVLNASTRKALAGIDAWLRAHSVPVKDPARR
ncbi:ankyrin repeat domain-containing protein [Luteimonas notoginsengisoli]|jgi:ankyrin repeat protein|uniref:Ankyrin repeat domain-containing protein n=1 Tax=Luteimonas notoginsengisoli TaxID=1578200 RepID=A0ABV7UTY7_9GAMM